MLHAGIVFMPNEITPDIYLMDDLVMVVVHNQEQFSQQLDAHSAGKCRYHPEKFPTLFVMCQDTMDGDEIYNAISAKMDSAQCQDVRFITLLTNDTEGEMDRVAARLVQNGATFENNPYADSDFFVYILAVKMRDLSIVQAENCPYDAALVPKILCRNSQNTQLHSQCNGNMHEKFFGGTKSCLSGCFIPTRLQANMQKALQKIQTSTQVITMVVNLKENKNVIRGEIETLHIIDTIDPNGIFTAKLIYEEILLYDKNDQTLKIVDSNLTAEENMQSTKKQKSSGRQKYNDRLFHQNLQTWMLNKVDLHFIYMVYTGKTMRDGLPKHLDKCVVYKAFKNLLLNYRLLNLSKIWHMDLHYDNVTYIHSAGDGLSLKLIDFGFSRSYQERKGAHADMLEDVSLNFMHVCDIMTQELRDWHPVEYVMFQFCFCMMIGPFLVRYNKWTPKMHIDKTNAMLKFNKTTPDDTLMQFWDHEPLYNAQYGNARRELCNLWKNIFKYYARIDEILIQRWRRVCCTVGKLVHAKQAENIVLSKPLNSFHSFTQLQFYDTYFKDFRNQYYSCADGDMSVINGEFDVFSMGLLILNHYKDENVEIKNIILTKLFSNQYEKLPCQRLTETAEAIQRLEVLFFDLT